MSSGGWVVAIGKKKGGTWTYIPENHSGKIEQLVVAVAVCLHEKLNDDKFKIT